MRPSLTALAVGLALLVTSCANPVPPTGGPRDETPPRVERTRPAQDSVNVGTDTRTIAISFSEYVERSSLARAISITPPFDQPLEFDWSGRDVEVELPQDLRDSTTYIVTLDATLSDTRGVELDEPITFAFATGPRIDRGQIAGRVVEPSSGEPEARVDIFAYPVSARAAAPPSPLPDPVYRTQTGDDGTFTLDYLREQSYFVLALRDNNRNRSLDSTEAFAVPPSVAVEADSGSAEVLLPWVLDLPDRIPPRLTRLRPVTQQRLSLTFSEPVVLASRSPDDWQVQDSTSQASVPVTGVFRAPDDSASVDVLTSTMQPVPHRFVVTGTAVTDTLGRPLAPDTVRFVPPSVPDTTQTRFRSFLPTGLPTDSVDAHRLLPGAAPGFRLSQFPFRTAVDQFASVQDTAGTPRAVTFDTDDGVNFTVAFADSLAADALVELRVDARPLNDTDTTYVRRYRRVASRFLGELEGRAVLADTTLRSASFDPSPRDTLRADTAQADSLQADSLQADSLQADSLQADSLQADSLQTDSLRTDSLSVDSLQTEPARADSVRADSMDVDSVQSDSVQTNRIPPDSVRTDTSLIVVELYRTASDFPVPPRSMTSLPDSTFVFGQLPEGSFRFRAYLDRNGNGRWDPGQVSPYVPAEPVTWSAQPVDTRPRWTNVLPEPLRILQVQEE